MNSPGDPELDALLGRPAALPPLADDGFSRRVLAALPPPARARPRAWWSRPAIVATLGGLAGLAYALAAGVEWPDAHAVIGEVGAAGFAASQALADPQNGLVALALAAAAVIAFLPEREST